MLKLLKNLTEIIDNRSSKNYSFFNIVGDSADWVLDYEARKLESISRLIGIKARYTTSNFLRLSQCYHETSQFVLAKSFNSKNKSRISVDYFHGRVADGDVYKEIRRTIEQKPRQLYRIRVSHSLMKNYILEIGFDSNKVHQIPISIDTDLFRIPTIEEKIKIRSELNLPSQAVIIGSFLKDGNGWGEGLEPKMIKGPDIFLKAINILKERVKDLHILLTGPARGYVKKGLEEMKVPYTHKFLSKYEDIAKYFHAIDVCIVSSRLEGGPKAILESMASGVPIITTRVGQALDLVKHHDNGFMVDIEDADGLANWTEYCLNSPSNVEKIIENARLTAENNSYYSQIPQWRNFFDGYVENF